MHSFSPSWRRVQTLALVSVLLCLLAYTATWGRADSALPRLAPDWAWRHALPQPTVHETPEAGAPGSHAIERLMRAAEQHFAGLLAAAPTNVSDAARRYRARRGRHPPPGFGRWYAYAERTGAVVPEVFFDQVYRDLRPFWGVPVEELRRGVRGFRPRVVVRGGGVASSDAVGSYARVRGVVGMLEELGRAGVALPDADIPLNVNDEIAMLVPWQVMETAVEFVREFMPPPRDVVGVFSALEDDGIGDGTFDAEWLGNRLHHKMGSPYFGPRPLWSLVQTACPPDSVTAKAEFMADIWHPQGHTRIEHSAAALLPLEPPANSSEGYMANWTAANDVCKRPNLQGLYGGFVAPKSMSVSQKLFPLFSASKVSASNEILIPTLPSSNTSVAASPSPWNKKEAKLYWRGPASGGVNSKLNWQRMHRHRFVSMLNATQVEIAEALLHAGNESTVGLGYAGNFRLLPANAYHLATQKGATMAEWVNGWADASFTDLQCAEPAENVTCSYTDEYFSVEEENGRGKGNYKYAAVLDGDAGDDGGEFVRHLKEGRVVLRSSVYKQWHDARLVPWLHFVPMDNTFVDLYSVMEYFLGSAVSSNTTAFAHAHVEVAKHEHHFQTPHWDEDDEKADGDGNGHGKHGRRPRELSGQSAQSVGVGHDARAQEIAEAAQQWAHQVLRREDMLLYLYRLLLEYARVVDAKRHTMGWVSDLMAESALHDGEKVR